MKKAFIAIAIVAAMSVPTLSTAAACKTKKVVCQPVACAPCFNPLSIVGGVVQGVGCAVSSIGAGIAGVFGCAPACY